MSRVAALLPLLLLVLACGLSFASEGGAEPPEEKVLAPEQAP
jgi:hypothetical protein